MKLPERVEIMEVCPRDGWQNHKVLIPTETKIKYIKEMIDCGASSMDVTSFVSPKAVPQMADAFDAVSYTHLKQFSERKRYSRSSPSFHVRRIQMLKLKKG